MKKILFLILMFFLAGCGYTTHSLLPSDYKSIYVENFKNSIDVAAEQTNVRMYRGYHPGMETELTRVVINKFLIDGNLKVASPSSADVILKGELIDYKRDALLYDSNQNVDEYRVKIFVNIELYDVKAKKAIWQEKSFAGETTYRTGGSLAKTENAAISDAMVDLARRIVERTVEAW